MKKMLFYTVLFLVAGLLAAGCLGKPGASNAEAKGTPEATGVQSDDSESLPEGAATKTTGDYLKEINKALDSDDYEKGRKLCEEALQKDPEHSMLLTLLGTCYYHDGNYEEAVKYFDKSLSVEVNANQNYIYRGQSYIHLGKYREAITDFDKVMKYVKEFHSLYNSRGMAYALNGDIDKAMADFNKAVELEPESESARENRGFAFMTKGDFAKANTDLSKAVELNPDFVRGYASLALCMILQKNNSGAAAELEKALKKNPEDSFSLYVKGLNNLRTGKASEAKKDFEDGKRVDKNNETLNMLKAIHDKYGKSEIGKASAEILTGLGIMKKETVSGDKPKKTK